jgi:predicted PhzF superfamily epimerase YddE/YHI9
MRIRVVDAFTDRPFAGNPAAVCVLAAGPWPDEDWMRAVAAEMNLSETAFARPSEDPDADWDLRWFTPKVEARMCGHATLATTHAMAADGLVSGKVRFSSLSGILVAEVGGGPGDHARFSGVGAGRHRGTGRPGNRTGERAGRRPSHPSAG